LKPLNKRRTLICAGGMLLAGRAAIAQPARKFRRIGIISASLAADFTGPQPVAAQGKALLRGLGELGYVYGQQYVTEVRNLTAQPGGAPAVMAELAGLGVEVIVAAGPTLLALKAATATIPVVMAAGIDPVGDGLIQSLRRPGTNFTGLSHQFADGVGKRLELLKELVPGTAPVAVLWDQGSRSPWEAAQAAAKSRGWKLLSLEIKAPGDIEAALKSAAAARAGTLLVLTGTIAFPNRQRITELATRYRLPGMFDLRPYVDAGGLMSYGADLIELWHQSARFVDKILKGAGPAELPVEQPTRFELVINLKAAKAVGLTISPSMRLRADEVIE
jgi:putative ABC transport system substrate-binding protein